MLPPLLQKMVALGFDAFDGGHAFNLNLIGIRSSNRDQTQDAFDDLITCTYREEKGGRFICKSWAATTDPGLQALLHPEMYNSEGTLIMARGQYKAAYVLGLHRNKYEALVQRGPRPISYFRDNTKDATLDLSSTIMQGFVGANIHKAGEDSQRISGVSSRGRRGTFSAGCQVLKREQDFHELLDLCRLQIEHNQWTRFTYSLIYSEDLL